MIIVKLWGKHSEETKYLEINGCLGDLLDQRVCKFLQLLHCQIALQNDSINLDSANIVNGLQCNCLFIYLLSSLGYRLFKDFLISQSPASSIQPGTDQARINPLPFPTSKIFESPKQVGQLISQNIWMKDKSQWVARCSRIFPQNTTQS